MSRSNDPTNIPFINAGIRLIGEPSDDFWTFRWSDFNDGIKIGLSATAQVTDFVENASKVAEDVPVLGQFLAPVGATARQLSTGIRIATQVSEDIARNIDDAPAASVAPVIEAASSAPASFKGKLLGPVGAQTAFM